MTQLNIYECIQKKSKVNQSPKKALITEFRRIQSMHKWSGSRIQIFSLLLYSGFLDLSRIVAFCTLPNWDVFCFGHFSRSRDWRKKKTEKIYSCMGTAIQLTFNSVLSACTRCTLARSSDRMQNNNNNNNQSNLEIFQLKMEKMCQLPSQ